MTGATGGELLLSQFAFGGAGGGVADGVSGTAGTAASSLGRSTSAQFLTLISAARGGDAVAAATGVATGAAPGTVSVSATAQGGTGHGGNAGSAVATAQGSGSGGTADASASSAQDSGLALSIASTASAPVDGQVKAMASSAVGGPLPSPDAASGSQAVAYATGAPTAVSGRLIANPTLTLALPAASDILAYGVLGGAYATGTPSGSAQTYQGESTLSFDTTQIANPPQHLLIGLLDPVGFGTVLGAFDFAIVEEGATVFQRTFTDLALALWFFNDRVLDLGSWSDRVSADGVLDLRLSFTLLESQPDTGFYMDYVVADGPAVPLPSVAWLLGAGLLGWSAATRARAGSSAGGPAHRRVGPRVPSKWVAWRGRNGAWLNLPSMRYVPDRKLAVYAAAVRGPVELEPDPEKKLKYLDFIDIYADLDDKEFVDARLYPDEATLIQDALRHLVRARPELRIDLAVHKYRAGDISLAKAAELAGISWAQMKDVLLEKGVAPRLGPDDTDEARDEAEVLRASSRTLP